MAAMDIDEKKPAEEAAKPAKEEIASEKPVSVKDSLASIVAMLESAVKQRDIRLIASRLLRQTAVIRGQLTPSVLVQFFNSHFGPDAAASKTLLTEQLQASSDLMQVESSSDAHPSPSSTLIEVEAYAFLITSMHLLDSEKNEAARLVADKAVAKLSDFNRRTLDTISSRLFFNLSLAYEKLGRLSDLRPLLLTLHRTSVLRHDAPGQEVLVNLLLRNYLHYKLYDQAEKFRSKALKADGTGFKSNQQYSRYLYYVGRIQTIQLEYTDAKDSLQQAVRKAPFSAQGFKVTTTRWLIMVRLLLGEVPERQEFELEGLGGIMDPYLELTQSVRSGDLVSFAEVAERHDASFRQDGTHNLIVRLRHNVIRTGLRRINLAYSRISLADIAAKLHLPSVADTECIVAKAIRDGGIDATIDHEGGFMQSNEATDVYSSGEPQAAFHARIAFCLDLHNEAVKAMRYDPDAHKKMLLAIRGSKDRISSEELAKAIEESEMDEDY